MDTMISGLGMLVDNTADDDTAVRAAALDAAITHMAGDGCKIADSSGSGNPVVGCARTFERYLTGADPDPIAPGTRLRVAFATRLREAAGLLARHTTDGDEEGLVGDLYHLAGILDPQTKPLDDAPAGGR